MATTEGNAGTGARWYGDELETLRGVLASDLDNAVYPDNYCAECVREGRKDDDRCFHRHWQIADEVATYERR